MSIGRPASAGVGWHRPSLAGVIQHRPAGVGRHQPALAGVGRHRPASAGIRRRRPASASIRRRRPASAAVRRHPLASAGVGPCWPASAGRSDGVLLDDSLHGFPGIRNDRIFSIRISIRIYMFLLHCFVRGPGRSSIGFISKFRAQVANLEVGSSDFDFIWAGKHVFMKFSVEIN